jgi:hypothetical protein
LVDQLPVFDLVQTNKQVKEKKKSESGEVGWWSVESRREVKYLQVKVWPHRKLLQVIFYEDYKAQIGIVSLKVKRVF